MQNYNNRKETNGCPGPKWEDMIEYGHKENF